MEYEFEPKLGKFGNLFYRTEDVAYTHNGVFHADDVCSAALLEIVFPGIEIRRVSAVPEDAELAFDIGYGRYDHHQQNAELRDDGNKYAAFGLLWRDLGTSILSKSDAKFFDDVFVKQIDYTDNTGFPNSFSAAIKAMNPAWNEEGTADAKFKEAVAWAKVGIMAQFKRYMSAKEAEGEIERDMADPKNYPSTHIFIMERYKPYNKHAVPSPIHFVMYPSNRTEGAWNISTVPTEVGGKIPKTELPDIWGKCPPCGCTYVNPSRTMAVFNSKENIMKVVPKLEMSLYGENDR